MEPKPDPALQRWNERFAAEGYLFGTQPNAFLESQAFRLSAGMRALCVADGEGRNSVWLARRGLAVTAFDFSPVAIEKARRGASAAGVQVDYRVCNILEWNWSGERFDVLVAIFIQFLSPAQRAEVFARFADALRPGGLLILQGYRPEQLAYRTGGPPEADHMYTEPLLRELLRGWEILHLRSHDDAIEEGTGHKGMSALIDVVAKKKG